mgnify:CR=1 FL=1
MKLQDGDYYTLRNLATRQYAQFWLLELHKYQGQYICYGEVSGHSVHVPWVRGVEKIPPRASCPVLLLDDREAARFTDAVGGLPLALDSDGAWKVAVNMPFVAGFGKGHDGRPKDKAEYVELGARIIDLWREWRRHGEGMPSWFTLLRNNARAGLTPAGLSKN